MNFDETFINLIIGCFEIFKRYLNFHFILLIFLIINYLNLLRILYILYFVYIFCIYILDFFI
jgi:hypothetical protein